MILSKYYYLSDLIIDLESIEQELENFGYSEKTREVVVEALKQTELAYAYLNRLHHLLNNQEYEDSFHKKLVMDLDDLK